jgi:predicted nicotinamide N-methyase
VLELGSGAMGYPGLVAAIVGGPKTRVILTDNQTALLTQLEEGVNDNQLLGRCAVQIYEWRGPEPSSSIDMMQHDVVIASDVLYSLLTTSAFCDALERLVGANTHVLVSAPERWSRCECMEEAAKRGWQFDQVGGARYLSAEQMACVQSRELDMCEVGCFVYTVSRQSGPREVEAPSTPAPAVQSGSLAERLQYLQVSFPSIATLVLKQFLRKARGNVSQATEALLAAIAT